MSEYQYYEFLAVDRPLDDGQLDELRALSTRARITPTGLVNTYHWGDFRGNPRKLMERYFDAFLYLANWGRHRLMIRLPARLLDRATAQRYCVGHPADCWATGAHVILDLVSQNEDGDWEEGGEERLASIIPARAELASGDLRLLYLAWLLCAQVGDLEDDDTEPPIPPGLQTLTASLRGLADFLRIDDDLLAVAAMASESAAPDDTSELRTLALWIESLSVAEKNAVLLRVAQGDVHLRMELIRRFREQHRNPARPLLESARSVSYWRLRRPAAPNGRRSRRRGGSRNVPVASARRRSPASDTWMHWRLTRNMPGSG